MTRLCISCEQNPPRPLPDPIPDDTDVMFTEALTGRSLYCQPCFDAGDEEEQ